MDEESNLEDNDEDNPDLDKSFADLAEEVRGVPVDQPKSAFEQCEKLLKTSNKLVKKVRTTEGVKKDAHVVSDLALTIHESTKLIDVSESTFDSEIFAKAVLNLIRSKESNWAVLAAKSASIYLYAPGPTYMPAVHDAEVQSGKVTERKPRQARQPLEQRREPENVETITNDNEGGTVIDSMYKQLFKYYVQNRKSPICFFQFTVDPNSFSRTIDNIFRLSFLARDGLVRINLNDENLPELIPLRPPDKNNTKSSETVQALVSMTPLQWRDIVREFNITKAMIQ